MTGYGWLPPVEPGVVGRRPAPQNSTRTLNSRYRHTMTENTRDADVTLDTEQGRTTIHAEQRGGQLTMYGISYAPADTVQNRTRARVTDSCPLCPGFPQAQLQEESPGGTYLHVLYRDCGHAALADLETGHVTVRRAL